MPCRIIPCLGFNWPYPHSHINVHFPFTSKHLPLSKSRFSSCPPLSCPKSRCQGQSLLSCSKKSRLYYLVELGYPQVWAGVLFYFFPELEIIHYCILKRKLKAVHFSFASAKTDELVFQLHREIHRANQKARVQLLYN